MGTVALPGGWPTRSQLQATDFSYFGQVADWLGKIRPNAENALETLTEDVKRPGGVDWEGAAAEAAIVQAAADLVRARSTLWSWDDVAQRLPLWQDNLEAGKRLVLDAVDDAERDGFQVSDDYTVTDTRASYASQAERDARQAAANGHAGFIWHRVATLVGNQSSIDTSLKAMTAKWGTLTFPESGGVRAVDFKQGTGSAQEEDKRRQNQIDAFKHLFGREPTSAADWSTAAALDPHSYDPKYQGVPPEIRVVKIRPVPGQGVVRVSQYIEQRDVTGSLDGGRDFGDNRTANPHFDPQNARVTTYIDYENGIVVMRQNPSVQLNDNGGAGQVKVGVPQGSVTQKPDGAVRIKYDAGNPFAPRISAKIPDHPWTVNGDLVFTPAPGGVHVDGTRTDYPSMEVYQDLPNGTTRTVLIDPAIAGNSAGPMVNLPFHHDVGIGGQAFDPFDRGGWNPRYDVRVPLPATDFGPVANPPSVAPLPVTGPGIPA